MEYRRELINFGKGVPVRCFIHQLGHAARHLHSSLELLFVVSGSVVIYVEGESYTLESGDVILINSNAPHELTANEAILTAVQIKLSLFEDKILHAGELWFDCNSQKDPGNPGIQRIKRIVAEFVKVYSISGEGRTLRARSLCYALLSELMDCFKVERGAENEVQNDYQYKRIARIIEYINDHYSENISLQQIAEREYLSVPYLSKFFQRMMGTGFATYLGKLRLSQAIADLSTTDDTIEIIAERNGFPNTQSFVHQFKKRYAMLPSQWRKQHTDEHINRWNSSNNDYTILDTHEYLSYFAAYLDNSKADAVSADDPQLPDIASHNTIDVERKGIRLRNTWKTFMGVGSARELLQANIQQMLAELQKSIGFRYVKFHGILSDDMHVVSVDRSGKLQYSFVYVDMAIDFLLSIGLKPLIQLSFMPKALAMTPTHSIFESTMINSKPVSNEAWCELVREFLFHMRQRYGVQETGSWLYTIWNEPDTPISMFGFEKDEEFYHFYRDTWHTIKAVNPQYQIGTPSIYFDPLEAGTWMRRFSIWCKEHGCLPDFVIIHYYGTVITKDDIMSNQKVMMGKMQLTMDENMLTKCTEMVRGYVSETYSPETPIYLTEWNFSPSHRDLLGDTCFRSCYLVKNILENYDRLDSMGYWLLTDLFEEHQVPADVFHGGLGLYTYNGIRKPVWYAYWLLSKLGDELLECGDGYFLTRQRDTYQLMLYHYQHYSALYAANEIFDMTATNRYTPFGAKQRRSFSVRLMHVEEGPWHALEYSLGRQSGSAFDKWVEMGAQPIESEEEAELLQSLSRPMLNKYTLMSNPQGLVINAVLEPLEVKLILLRIK